MLAVIINEISYLNAEGYNSSTELSSVGKAMRKQGLLHNA